MPIDLHPRGANPQPNANPSNASNSAGAKRNRPDDGEDDSARKKQRRGDPATVAAAWNSALTTVRPSVHARLTGFFENLANEALTPIDLSLAQELFNELIVTAQWTLLIDVFDAYQAVMASQPPKTGGKHERFAPPPPPFQRTLVLQLPAGWAPADHAELVGALESLNVEKLVLLRPKSTQEQQNYERYLVKGEHRAMDTIQQPERSVPVPAAVCVSAAILLKNGGVHELGVEGVLADPDTLAQVLPNSGLRTATFMTSLTEFETHCSKPLSDAEARSYRALALGLEGCATLEDLSLGHADLLELHDSIARFAAPGGPHLKTLNLQFEKPQIVLPAEGAAPATSIQAFMRAVQTLTTLTALYADVEVPDRATLKAVFLDPLKGHPSLTRLRFGREFRHPAQINESNLQSFPEVFLFAVTCRKLTHFSWESIRGDDELGDLLEAYRRAGGRLTFPELTAAMVAAMQNPNMALTDVNLQGICPTQEQMDAFYEALRVHPSLRNVAIGCCPQPLESAVKAPRVFKENARLESLTLGYNFDDYYITLGDGTIVSMDYDDPDDGHFKLKKSKRLNAEQNAEAAAKLSSLREHADELSPSLKRLEKERCMERNLRSALASMNATTTTTPTTTTTTSTTTSTTTAGTAGKAGSTSSAAGLMRTPPDTEQPQ